MEYQGSIRASKVIELEQTNFREIDFEFMLFFFFSF